MLPATLTDFLRTHRTECNKWFAAARLRHHRLDAEEFSLFLKAQLSPLAATLETVSPEKSNQALVQAYKIGLQLVAEKLAGPAARKPTINLTWTQVFPEIPTLITQSPRRILAALGNAAHQLANTPDTDPETWRNRLLKLAPNCKTPEDILITAQILAWRAGLAHYRETALAAADSLPTALALQALDAPPNSTWLKVKNAHLQNPWFTYHENSNQTRKIGSFRGFGGLFLTPPLVSKSDEQILITSAKESWILIADAFGATFHRATPQEISSATRPSHSLLQNKTVVRTSPTSHSIQIRPA